MFQFTNRVRNNKVTIRLVQQYPAKNERSSYWHSNRTMEQK